ncbi:enoyl-CoA hydratase [Frondihabitans sucicola]|uniref:Enoyl-CoA hydratase n=1 Tax=Frondihabitans sucicola TaxID=1268041 RepID=A0ABM8GHM8_9MICO|nr:enoyl-CoA hydratase-related protein [Frondihabitans sucicola]BDZ47861.1 enoyl-CoA hydratase [Frondihabitans sucicola]
MTRLDVDRPAAGVLRLRMNGPDTLNALDEGVKSELVAALQDAATDKQDRIVLLTGTGRAFSAGGDIRAMGTRSATGTIDVLTFGREITEGITGLQKPVVAAVNGLASGAGFNLALSSDIVVASPTAWFQQSFIRMGLMPDMGGTYLLAQAIGLHRAKAALLTAHRFTAEEATGLGFVTEIFDGDFDAEAVAYCAELAKRPPVAAGLTKLLANRSVDGTLGDALDRETLAQAVLSSTSDHKSAVDAFLAKRDLDDLVFTGE